MIVPANCTDRLQPLNVSVNKAAKEFLQRQFQDWYSSKIASQLQAGSTVEPVDMRMAVVKPLSARGMIILNQRQKSFSSCWNDGSLCAHIAQILLTCQNTYHDQFMYVHVYYYQFWHFISALSFIQPSISAIL